MNHLSGLADETGKFCCSKMRLFQKAIYNERNSDVMVKNLVLVKIF